MYTATPSRYDDMIYNQCGKSGLKLPAISLGLWQNFGADTSQAKVKEKIFRAFDLGITHFDLANNYGPPPGSAEAAMGTILNSELNRYRDELIISTKAGYDMWPGPYGDGGSRKYLIASLDQSLKRLNLDYVDIFYHHRYDPNTPLEETMAALDAIVRQGKALYIGLSNYGPKETKQAATILKQLGTPCVVNQPSYSMLNRWIEGGLQDVLAEEGIGTVAFAPLAMGLLTSKYLHAIPEGSRAAKNDWFKANVTEEQVGKVKELHKMAENRRQTMAQFALAWVLREGSVTSALIGASSIEQIEENVAALNNLSFSREELHAIDSIVGSDK
ncbi:MULTISPECIES: aldo/keto reductase [Shouchella]|uniref:Aldo/keto reductase n=1 Tax=Shouchella rhizosphaerae TaxID=866786 RepID=A0ABZ2CWU2_9BACI|nr:aldo/keto reductase [Shouchella clausii]PAE92103.1 L-glyceraldehyde 3-phosphate reductase [Shouchella clausii]